MQGYAVLVQDFGHYVEAVKSHSRTLSCRSYDKLCIFEDLCWRMDWKGWEEGQKLVWSSRDKISVIGQRDRALERDMVGPGSI